MSKFKTNVQKQLIVVGDRILVSPDDTKKKTSFGLYLPQGVEEKEKVQGGYVIKTGPGYPMPDFNASSGEPWSANARDAKYIPLQVEEGDYVLFLKKSAVDIEFERQHYLIVPHSSILLIVRDDLLTNISSEDVEKD